MSGETETLVSKNGMETSSSVSEAHSTVNCMFSSMEFNTQALESLGFDGAETNCRIAHILGTLLMISY